MKHPLLTPHTRRALSFLLTLSLCLSLLCACQTPTEEESADDTPIEHSGALITPVDPTEADDASEQYQEISGSFTVTSEHGALTPEGTRFVITAGGEYTLRGVLEEGQVYVNAPDQKVTLLLDGVSMSSAQRAVVFVEDADAITIKSVEGSYNELFDRRPMRSANKDDSTTGSGCIFSDADLKLSGKGALVVTSTYAHGVHSKKDLEIKNVTLKVSAPDCALRGNDSVTIESGELILISSGSDGIKTSNSDISSKGNQRGTVTIDGATVDIYAACDAIDAAYDVLLGMSDTPVINIYTDTYSSYTSTLVAGSVEKNPAEGNSPGGWNSWFGFGGMGGGNTSKSSHSAKGIKAHNTLTVKSGTLVIKSNDDALHAVADELLENGSKGKGLLYVDGGTLSITCTDDALHADTELIVSGGQIGVLGCYEGLESNIVTIKGGYTTVYADDDGVNACSGASTPTVRISGGYLSITVGSGDTDALDTNDTFEQTGGTLVVRGGTSGMASALDIERKCSVTGGTLVVVGNAERVPTPTQDCCMVIFGTLSSGMGGMGGPGGPGGPGGMGGMPGGSRPGGRSTSEQQSTNAASASVTTYTVEGTTISFTLETLGNLWIMSDQIKLGQSYTLSGGNDSISWTQSAVQTQVK